MPCMALVIPQEEDEDWREQEMWVEPMKLTDIVSLLGVPPLDVSTAIQDEGGDQEEDYNDADFEADFDEQDPPSSEGTDEFSTDGADDEVDALLSHIALLGLDTSLGRIPPLIGTSSLNPAHVHLR